MSTSRDFISDRDKFLMNFVKGMAATFLKSDEILRTIRIILDNNGRTIKWRDRIVNQ